jgi:FlaA1/EpsC-like NDP-sugar epimerase
MALYRPRRIEHLNREFRDITKCLFLTFLIMIVVIYLFRRFEFSRLAFFYFWMIGLLGLNLTRLVTRRALKLLRRRGYNQRFAVIAGTGELGLKVLRGTQIHSELGIQVIGFWA